MTETELTTGGRLPPEVSQQVMAFLATVDDALPGAVTGLYVVGSAALDDFRTRMSDIDLIAIGDSAWSDERVAGAVAAHRHVHRRHRPSLIAYLSWAELQMDPLTLHVPCFRGEQAVECGELVNPFTWKLLATSAIAVRGPERPPVRVDDLALREWAADQLTGRWRPWWQAHRRRPLSLLFMRSAIDPVLQTSRLGLAAYDGVVVSKTAAGEAVCRHRLPTWDAKVVADAVERRQGVTTSRYWGPIERKHDALHHVAEFSQFPIAALTPSDDRRTSHTNGTTA